MTHNTEMIEGMLLRPTETEQVTSETSPAGLPEDAQPASAHPETGPEQGTPARDERGRFTSAASAADAAKDEQGERNFEGELAESQQRINELTSELQQLKDGGRLTEDALHRLSTALAREIEHRSRIQSEYEAFRAKIQADLAQASQATQTLATEKQELERRVTEAEAKATKLEILTNEFPELLGYAELIPANTDPEAVRAACAKLQAARQRDLESVRARAVSGHVAALSGTPPRVESSLADPDAIGAYLREAMHDPVEFQRREAIVQQQLQAMSRRI